MANTPEKRQLSEEERADLKAMIAAGRELSPEMDESLVESYVERRAAEQRARAKVQGQQGQGNAVVAQPQPGHPLAGVHPAVAVTGIVTMAAVFIAIMVLSKGMAWWLIFPLFGIFGGWMGGNERHRIRNERRAQRYQMRADYYRARMGYPPRDDSRRLPEAESEDSAPLPPPIGVPTQTPPAPRNSPPAGAPPARSASDEQPPINPAG